MKNQKAYIGTHDSFNYVVKVGGIDNTFPSKVFGQAMEDRKALVEWKKNAKFGCVGSKGKATLASVKRWVKENNPSEYYASWRADSSLYKDDCVDIYYVP